MKKRLTATILAITMFLAILPATLFSASAETFSGTCGKNLTWTFDDETGTLEITGSGAMDNWFAYTASPWRSKHDEIKTITIGDEVTSIGQHAFYACQGLTSVTIGSSVEKIGDGAFSQCNGLQNIVIPDSVKVIDDNAFWLCKGLTTVSFGAGVESIGDEAFWQCTRLEKVVLPDSLKTIGVRAFAFCSKISNLTLGKGVETIDQSAFNKCTSLTDITIPDSVVTIDDYAFSGCTGAQRLVLGMNLEKIGREAFKDCIGLSSIVIPNSVKRIGAGAFDGCTGAETITVGEKVASIERDAFRNCTNLKTITLPDSLTTIGYYIFQGCTSLGKVTLGSGLTSISIGMFADCSSLNNISIGNSVTTINKQAFYKCTALTDVFFAGTKEEWDKITIGEYNDCLKAAKVHYKGEQEAPAFSDIPDNAWYVDAVDFAVENGLMNGVGDNKFDPEGSMTRAMLVTVLWRYEGSPKKGSNTFADVPNGQWYTDAIAWAAAEGVVGGVGNGKFEPDGNVTREQMATILFRYANKKGFDTSKRGNLSSFSDASKVSTYAKDALAWTVAEGIINGSDGYLLPQGDATRAQVSAILMRYIQNIAEAK